jgi:hypothetical protein
MHSIGTDFVWFMGVVEDRNDPLQMGRVRVRTHWQTADKNILPTEDLPWAQIIVPSSASSGDIGKSSTGYVEGSWVVGFFMDGEHKQHPLILGAISGIPTEYPDTVRGFNDPRGVYPQRLNEPDMNRLVRTKTIREESSKLARTEEETNASLHPSIPFRNQYVDDLTGEPIPSRNSEYPYSQVRETESGHIQEFDDTLGAERIATMHRTGTMEEYHPDGSRVNRTMKDNYHVTYGDDYVRVRGVSKVYIDGDASLYVRGKLVTQVDGDMETYVRGNYYLDVGRDINITTNGSYALGARQDISQKTTSTYNVVSNGKIDFSTINKFIVRSTIAELNEKLPEIITRAPSATILDPYDSANVLISEYSRKLDTGRGFQDVYRSDLGITPGGEQIGTAPDDSGQDLNSNSKYKIDVTTTAEAITTSRLVGNSGLIDSNGRPTGQQVEDLEAHGKNAPHLNALDVALSAKNLGPDLWIDGDSIEGQEKYPNPGNPNIINLFKEMGVLTTAISINPTRYDKISWSAVFVSAMLRRSGNKYLKTLSSRAYEQIASEIGILISTTYEPDKMKPGDILVFGRSGKSDNPFRSSPYGHIGFWTGNKNVPDGKIMCLGSNQSNRVAIRSFPIKNENDFGLVAVIRPVSGNDGKTSQPDPGSIREITAE